MRKRQLLGFFFLLISGLAGSAWAQLQPIEREAERVHNVSTFSILLASRPEGVFNAALNEPGAQQYWNAKRRHYCGTLLQNFYHPEIAAAGYRKVVCVAVEGNHSQSFNAAIAPTKLKGQTEDFIARTDQRFAPTYHFDSGGWLRAIRHSRLAPESEYFQETTDSFYYDFGIAGGVQIRWKSHEHSSGSGFDPPLECKNLPAFVHHYKTRHTVIMLDSFQNMILFRQRTEERWDTCTAGGPQERSIELTYDFEGKLLLHASREAPYNSPVRTTEFEYQPLSIEAFYKRTNTDKAFAPLREPLLKNWIGAHAGLKCIFQTPKSTQYKYYSATANSEVFRPDSPQVFGGESTYFMLDAGRNTVAYVPQTARSNFAFSLLTKDTATGAPVEYVQSLPKPPASPPVGTVVCEPLSGIIATGYRLLTFPLGPDTLTLFSVGRPAREIRENRYNTSVATPLLFTPSAPALSDYQTKSAVLTSPKGVVEYLWLPASAYALRYE